MKVATYIEELKAQYPEGEVWEADETFQSGFELYVYDWLAGYSIHIMWTVPQKIECLNNVCRVSCRALIDGKKVSAGRALRHYKDAVESNEKYGYGKVAK